MMPRESKQSKNERKIVQDVVRLLLSETTNNTASARKLLTAFPKLRLKASLGRVVRKLDALQADLEPEYETEVGAQDAILNWVDEDPVSCRVALLVRATSNLEVKDLSSGRDFNGCRLHLPVEFPFSTDLHLTSSQESEGGSSMSQEAWVPVLVIETEAIALEDDEYKAFEIAMSKADCALGSLRVALREASDVTIEPPIMLLSRELAWIWRDKEWYSYSPDPPQEVEINASVIARATAPEYRNLVDLGHKRIHGTPISELSERLLGAFLLINEAEKETSLMSKFLRYIGAIEQLTTYDSLGQANVTRVFSTRVPLLVIDEFEIAKLSAVLGTDVHDEHVGTNLCEALRKTLYKSRSRLAHGWEPGLADDLRIWPLVDLAHDLARGAMEAVRNLNDSFLLSTDWELSLFFNLSHALLIIAATPGLKGTWGTILAASFVAAKAAPESQEDATRVLQAARENLCRKGLCLESNKQGILQITARGRSFARRIAKEFGARAFLRAAFGEQGTICPVLDEIGTA